MIKISGDRRGCILGCCLGFLLGTIFMCAIGLGLTSIVFIYENQHMYDVPGSGHVISVTPTLTLPLASTLIPPSTIAAFAPSPDSQTESALAANASLSVPEITPTPETCTIVKLTIKTINLAGIPVTTKGPKEVFVQQKDGSLKRDFIIPSPERIDEIIHYSESFLPEEKKKIILTGHSLLSTDRKNLFGPFFKLTSEEMNPQTNGGIYITLFTSDGKEHHYIVLRRYYATGLGEERVGELLDLNIKGFLDLGGEEGLLILVSCSGSINKETGEFTDRVFALAVPSS